MPAAAMEAFLDLSVWIQIPAILVGSLIVAKLLELLGSLVLKQSERLTSQEYDRLIIEEIHLPLFVSIILSGVYVSAHLLPDFSLLFYVSAASISIIVALWARALIRLGNRVIGMTNDSPTGREIAPIFKAVLTFFVLLGTFFVLLAVWQVDVTPILASAGILGIIIGIAAQDSLGNFFGGLSLHFDKTYKLGDVIQVESGERGTVIDMSIRSTTILTRDNIAVTIPNREMNSTQIVNESAPVRRRRIRLNVGVAYGSDLEVVEESILEAADTEAIVMASPKPVVRFRRFDDSAIVAQLQCYIQHPAQRGRAHHLLIQRIDANFSDEGIKIPFPQQEVTFFEAGNEISVTSDPESELSPDLNQDVDYRIPDGAGNGE